MSGFSTALGRPKASEWACEICMITNDLSRTVCEACETPRTKGGAPTSLTQTVSQPSPSSSTSSLSFAPGLFQLTGDGATDTAPSPFWFGGSSTETTAPTEASVTAPNLLFGVSTTAPPSTGDSIREPLFSSEAEVPSPAGFLPSFAKSAKATGADSNTIDPGRQLASLLQKRSRDYLETLQQNEDSLSPRTGTTPPTGSQEPDGPTKRHRLSPALAPSKPTTGQAVDGFFASYKDEALRRSPLRSTRPLRRAGFEGASEGSQTQPQVALAPASFDSPEDQHPQKEVRFSFGVATDASGETPCHVPKGSTERGPLPDEEDNDTTAIAATPDSRGTCFATPTFGSSHSVATLPQTVTESHAVLPHQDSTTPERTVVVSVPETPLTLPDSDRTPFATGVVYTWGSGECDQLAVPDKCLNASGALSSPALIIKLRKQNVVSISCGALHSLALLDDGSVVAWGCNDDYAVGRLNDGIPERRPARVLGLPPVEDDPAVAIACGDNHSACLTESGSCYIWGSYKDSMGYIGFPDFEGLPAFNTLPSKKTHIPTRVPGIKGRCVRLAAGENHTVVLSVSTNPSPRSSTTESNGVMPHDKLDTSRVYAWGSGEFGQLARPPLSDFSNDKPSYLFPHLIPTEIFGPALSITNVFCGKTTTFIETKDFKMQAPRYFGVGRNSCAELGSITSDNAMAIPQELHKFAGVPLKDISSCQFASIALTEDGEVFTWGKGEYLGRPLTEESDSKTKATESSSSSISASPQRVQFPSEAPITSIGTGGDTLFAIQQPGVLYAWGEGQMFQIGDGNEYTDPVPAPILIPSARFNDTAVLYACGGSQHSLALVFNHHYADRPRPTTRALHSTGSMRVSQQASSSGSKPPETLVPDADKLLIKTKTQHAEKVSHLEKSPLTQPPSDAKETESEHKTEEREEDLAEPEHEVTQLSEELENPDQDVKAPEHQVKTPELQLPLLEVEKAVPKRSSKKTELFIEDSSSPFGNEKEDESQIAQISHDEKGSPRQRGTKRTRAVSKPFVSASPIPKLKKSKTEKKTEPVMHIITGKNANKTDTSSTAIVPPLVPHTRASRKAKSPQAPVNVVAAPTQRSRRGHPNAASASEVLERTPAPPDVLKVVSSDEPIVTRRSRASAGGPSGAAGREALSGSSGGRKTSKTSSSTITPSVLSPAPSASAAALALRSRTRKLQATPTVNDAARPNALVQPEVDQRPATRRTRAAAPQQTPPPLPPDVSTAAQRPKRKRNPPSEPVKESDDAVITSTRSRRSAKKPPLEEKGEEHVAPSNPSISSRLRSRTAPQHLNAKTAVPPAKGSTPSKKETRRKQ